MGPRSYGVFRYLASPEHAERYRAIMREFLSAKRRFIVHLRAEDLRAAIGGDDPAPHLTQLREWGNLRADPDTSRVTTVEDFTRARFIYQLTAEGERAELALHDFDQSLGRRGSLQSWALDEIATQLRALLVLSDAPEIDAAKARGGLAALTQTFTGLAENAQLFSGDLQRTLDLRGIDTEAFLAYKERLIEYLQRFIQDLLVRGAEIAEVLERLTPEATERLISAVVELEARDAAPDADASAGAADALLAVWRDRVAGFRQWFVGDAGPSQSARLRHMARAAIPDLLDTVRRLSDRRAGRSDRAADFRTLALWFAEAPGDDDRHRLARLAFGLGSARHLATDAGEPDGVPASTPWRDAPPVVVSPRLRATGSYERRGKPTSVRDRSGERLAIERAVAARRVAAERLRAQFVRDEPTVIGDLPLVDGEARSVLVGLLSDALARRSIPGEHVGARSLDGAFDVEVWPEPTLRTAVRLDDGTLDAPAHRIRIRDAS